MYNKQYYKTTTQLATQCNYGNLFTAVRNVCMRLQCRCYRAQLRIRNNTLPSSSQTHIAPHRHCALELRLRCWWGRTETEAGGRIVHTRRSICCDFCSSSLVSLNATFNFKKIKNPNFYKLFHVWYMANGVWKNSDQVTAEITDVICEKKSNSMISRLSTADDL